MAGWAAVAAVPVGYPAGYGDAPPVIAPAEEPPWGDEERPGWESEGYAIGRNSRGDHELLPAGIRGLLIGFAAVPDPEHSHGLFAFINLVNDSIVPDPNPPIILRAGELATPCRPRVLGQSTDVSDDTMEGLHWELPQIPLRCPFEADFTLG